MRYTSKNPDGRYVIGPDYEPYAPGKLAEFENLEAKAGMPLKRLVAIVSNGIWVVDKQGDNHNAIQIWNTQDITFDFDNKEIIVFYPLSHDVYNTYKFKDYRKTWALTKGGIRNVHRNRHQR